jgi:glycosyltransferase involved in cell wall biosynthesis
MIEYPLVSIIINSYNQGKFLEQCILSVINQDYPQKEVILIDGGSTDISAEIIKKYAHHFSWTIIEKDQGQADGINKGLKRTKGDLVAWLNSDDYYLPGAISRIIGEYRQKTDCAIYYGEVQAVDEQGKIINRMRTGNYRLQDLVEFKILNQAGVFFNGDTARVSSGLDLSYRYLLDHEFWLRIGSSGEIYKINHYLAAARFHNQAKNVANAHEFGDEAHRISRWLLSDDQFRDLVQSRRKRILAGAYRIDARYTLDGGNYSNALTRYIKGLMLSPTVLLPEIHRMIYALFGMAGLGKIRAIYERLRSFYAGMQ